MTLTDFWAWISRPGIWQKMLWSAGSSGFLIFLYFLARRIIKSMAHEELRGRYCRMAFHSLIFMTFLIFLFIWALPLAFQYFDDPGPVIMRLFGSLVLLLILTIVLRILKRLYDSLQTESKIRQRYWKWTQIVVFLIYGFILMRIWDIANWFAYFNNPILQNIFESAVALGIVYLILFFLRRFINSLQVDIQKRHQYRKRVTYTATGIYLIILIFIWAGSTTQWATVLSVMGAGVALALHEVLLNMAGWLYIMIRRPYRTGDRIELGDVRGDVIDVRLFQTTLLEIGNWVDGDQSTGRVVHLPHGQIFRRALYNYTMGFEYIWNEMSVIVTFESSWEKAREILLVCGEEASREVQEKVQSQIDRMSREYLIYYRKFTPIVYTSIQDSGVKLTLRYLTDARKRRSTENIISGKVIKAFKETADVDFAYTTYRITGR
ncbi:MAG TPA: mechanosensitive ion channel family protein [bacterium]|nr:mechanosensitive ion channel family protein [bacterium]